jgi:hypothetical protein
MSTATGSSTPMLSVPSALIPPLARSNAAGETALAMATPVCVCRWVVVVVGLRLGPFGGMGTTTALHRGAGLGVRVGVGRCVPFLLGGDSDTQALRPAGLLLRSQ